MKRPKFLRNYTPPSFDEMRAALPDVDPARLAHLHGLMCDAMHFRTYDRSEAMEKLRDMASDHARLAVLEELLAVQAAAEKCLLMYQWPYALWQQGVMATWDGRIVDDERAEVPR